VVLASEVVSCNQITIRKAGERRGGGITMGLDLAVRREKVGEEEPMEWLHLVGPVAMNG